MRTNSPQAEARPWLLAIFLAALVVLSLMPHSWKGHTALKGWFHVGAHVLAFALAVRIAARRWESWTQVALIAAGLLIFGITLELLEAIKFGNRLEYLDMISDTFGILAGISSLRLFRAGVISARRQSSQISPALSRSRLR